MLKLRPYQSAARSAVATALGGGETRLLVASATGTGKTPILASIITDLLNDPFGEGPVIILAHQEELLDQAKKTVVNWCGLEPYYMESSEGLFGEGRMVDPVQYEMGDLRSDCNAKVILASFATVYRPGRLLIKPRAVIFDECDRAPSKEGVKILHDLGCFDPIFPTPLIGLTATVVRTDKKQLYAYKIDGTPMPIRGNKQADRDKCVFQRMVFEYSMWDAICDGWLVDVAQRQANIGVDLTGVGQSMGDFKQGELAERLEDSEGVKRIRGGITLWLDLARNEQTIAFCGSVKHSETTAEMFRLAGIMSVEHIDGKMPKEQRRDIMGRFRCGDIQVLTNYGIVARGVDVPHVSCGLLLRPTTSWSVFAQMVGRLPRPLPGCVDPYETVAERLAAIAASPKKRALAIDMPDLFGKFSPITVPNIVGLPSLDLQGHTLREADAVIRQFDEATARAKIELAMPTKFDELVVAFKSADTLAAVHERKQSQARRGRTAEQPWTVAMNVEGEAYRYVHTSPGREALLTHDASGWHLRLTEKGKEVARKDLPSRVEMVGAFNTLTPFVKHIWPPAVPVSEQSTCSKLSPKQFAVLRRAGIQPEEIDGWHVGRAKIVVGLVLSGKWKPKDREEVAA